MATRAQCASAQKNYNYLYLTYILLEQGLDPGKYLEDHTEFTMKRFTKKSELSKTTAFKKRRIENRKKNHCQEKKRRLKKKTLMNLI